MKTPGGESIRPALSGGIRQYGLAVLASGVAVLIDRAMIPIFGFSTPYLTVYPAIILSSVLLGMGPGLAASVIGVLASEKWLVPHIGQPSLSWQDSLRAAMVTLSAFYLGQVGRRLRAAQSRAEADADQIRESERRLRTMGESLERRVADRTAKLQALALEITEVEQHEREKLAQVLHDHLQQLLVAAQMRLAVIRPAPESAEAESKAKVHELIKQAIEEARTLAVELNPPVLRQQGLGPALVWLAEWMQEKHDIQIDLVTVTGADRIPAAARPLVFQSVRELLLNVAKHAGTKQAHVRVKAAGERQITIEVEDRGTGFDPAARGSEKCLGLSSIRQRLDALAGTLEVHSAPGRGTRVVMQVPVRESAMVADEVETAETATAGELARSEAPEAALRRAAIAREGGRTPEERITVMVVDDHRIFREGLTGILRDQPGLAIVGEAADGEAAVDLARRCRPDVILMDINMPRLDGIEATRRIVSAHPGIRVIGLSTYPRVEKESDMRAAGAFAYLTKDSPADMLIRTIREAGLERVAHGC